MRSKRSIRKNGRAALPFSPLRALATYLKVFADAKAVIRAEKAAKLAAIEEERQERLRSELAHIEE